MQYVVFPQDFTEFPQNFLKSRANLQIQRPTHVYLFMKMKSFLLHLKEHIVSFNLIYLEGSILGKIWENIESTGLYLWRTPPPPPPHTHTLRSEQKKITQTFSKTFA